MNIITKEEKRSPRDGERNIFRRFQPGYCAYGHRVPNCENCSMVNYGRDCHNNPV